MIDDATLLQRYVSDADEAAFRELVDRHIGVVYGSALRCCGGRAADAADVTQRVFTELVRQAKTLTHHPALVGWLHTTTRFTAMKLLRDAARRLQRERASVEVAEIASDDAPVDWGRLQGLLDEVMARLKDRERAALILRFLEGKSLRDVGEQLHLTESAVRSCIDRALEKLRHELRRRGLVSTAAALGTALAEHASAAAPAGLAGSVAHVALTAGAAEGTALITTLVMKKLILGVCALLAVSELATATVTLKTRANLLSEYAEPSKRVASSRTNVAGAKEDPARSAQLEEQLARDSADLARLRARVAQLKARPPGIIDSEMRPPLNLGRATPQDFGNTVVMAVRAGDVDQLAKYLVLADDTPENRAAFMAHFSDAVRARYQTPEKLVISIQMAESLRDPPVALQFMDAPTDYEGVMLLKAWDRRASGVERQDYLPVTQTAEGWGIGPVPLSDATAQQLLAQIDPATGDARPQPNPPVHP